MITLESLIKMQEPTKHTPQSECSKPKRTYRINPEAEAQVVQIVKKYTRIQRKELINHSNWSNGTICRIIAKLEANKTFKVERGKTKHGPVTFISMMSE